MTSAMHANGREPTVALLGHYGNRNLGDEAIVAATLSGLRRAIAGVVPVAVSMDPHDSARRHGVAAFPVRGTARSAAIPAPGPDSASAAADVPDVGPSGPDSSGARSPLGPRWLRRLLRPVRGVERRIRDALAEARFLGRAWCFVRRVDLVVVTGSNQFLDNFGGATGYPWTLFKWTVLARLAGARVAFVSVGAGPLEGRASLALVRAALRLAHSVSYRDAASRRLVEGARTVPRGRVCPDLAFALERRPVPRRARVETVGINPMPVHDPRYWPGAEPARYRAYVTTLAELIGRLRADGYRPFLYATQPSDEWVIADVLAATEDPEAVPVHGAGTLDALLDTIDGADLLVPTRFHGTVLGLLAGRPVVAICYHRKTADVMTAVELGDHALAFNDLGSKRLYERVADLARHAPEVHATIDRTIEAHRAALEEQFATVAGLLSNTPATQPEIRTS